jgi:hypothetical protein
MTGLYGGPKETWNFSLTSFILWLSIGWGRKTLFRGLCQSVNVSLFTGDGLWNAEPIFDSKQKYFYFSFIAVVKTAVSLIQERNYVCRGPGVIKV